METESRAQSTNQTQTDSLSPSPNPVSPVPLNNPTSGPRYGTVIPNRIFVGGIDFKTNENDLRKFFSQYGSVKEVKIVNDRAGVSKGYWRCQGHEIPAEECCRCSVDPAHERSVLQSTKLKGVGDLKSALTSDMDLQNLEFALLVFSLPWSSIPYCDPSFPF